MAGLSMLFMKLFIITIFPCLIQLVQYTNADPRSDIISKTCEEKVLQNASMFLTNYWQANIDLQRQIFEMKHGFAFSGTPPDRVYVVAVCYGDLSQDDCNICYTQSRYIISSCMPHAGGRAYLDGCFIRAADYDFVSNRTTELDNVVRLCGSGPAKDLTYENMVRRVVLSLIGKAVDGNGYADASESPVFGIGSSVYAQANCWQMLDMPSCAKCLEEATNSIVTCLPANEGRVLKAGCVVRYSDDEFLNKIKTSSLRAKTLGFIMYVLGGTAIAISAICIGVFAGKIIFHQQNNRQTSFQGIDGEESSLFKRSLRFKYSTIEKATNHFSEANKLGQGGFGEVFKGSLADGREIAVKRLYVSASNRSEEVYHEMNVISHAHNRNLVRFLGCCITSIDSLLVYEFVPNKSLNLILFDPEKKKELDWKKRLGIIMGTAEGLAYLHEDCPVVVVHRDIKASNILLDLKFRPKIADFGLARFCTNEGNPAGGIAIAGTFGYMAPEYMTQGQLTEKVDVFSYGVLVLEIVTGIQNNKFTSDESLETIVTWAWKHFKLNRLSEIIDKNIEIDQKAEDNNMEEIKRIVQVGLLCTQEAASLRPTMKEVIQMLKQQDGNQHLPEPSKPPFFDETLGGSSNCLNSCHVVDYNDDQIPNICKSHYNSANNPS